MNINIKIEQVTPTPPAPAGDFYRVKRYDEMLEYYNWDMLGITTGNFGYVQVHVIGLGEGSTAIYTTLTPGDVQRLKAMQYPQTLSVDQKMTRLIYAGKYVHPMWTNDPNNGWQTAAEVRNGACVYTNQRVLIDKYATLKAKVPGQSYDGLRQMGRLVCFKKSDWGKTYANAPHLIHHYTGVTPENVHVENPHGEIFIPILDPNDFNVRPQNSGVVKEYWIDMEYIVKV